MRLLMFTVRRVEKKKMTQGWVVYGGMRHAEPHREMFSRSYEGGGSLATPHHPRCRSTSRHQCWAIQVPRCLSPTAHTWTTSASGTPWARWFLLRDPHLHAAHLGGFTFSLLEKAAMIPIRRCVSGGLGQCTLNADVCFPRSQPVCHGHCRFQLRFR